MGDAMVYKNQYTAVSLKKKKNKINHQTWSMKKPDSVY